MLLLATDLAESSGLMMMGFIGNYVAMSHAKGEGFFVSTNNNI